MVIHLEIGLQNVKIFYGPETPTRLSKSCEKAERRPGQPDAGDKEELSE